jgi:hypothetical protein
MKLCPQCQKENPHSANHCMSCGAPLVANEELSTEVKLQKELIEAKETNQLLKSLLDDRLKNPEKKQPKPSEPTKAEPIPKPSPPVRGDDHDSNQKNNSKRKSIAIILVLLLVASAVFGIFYYINIYLPEKIDREASRYYTFAVSTNFRSSKIAGVDYNKIGSIPYGSELITYEHNQEWSSVKFNGNKGYISSDYLLDKSNFFILNSIFGDQESKECVATTKCRKALISYFKKNRLIGSISSDLLNEILPGFSLTDSNQWQIFCRPASVKPNAVFYPRLSDKNAKYTDFAVLIKNIKTGERKILIFGFNDDETSFLFYEEAAPETGYIKNITIRLDTINIIYSD